MAMIGDPYGPGWSGVGRDGAGGLGVRTGATGTSTTSAKKNNTWGEVVGVVYGCAVVKGVPLMLEANGTGAIALDGTNYSTIELALAQYGFASGPVASIDGLIYEDRLYGATAISPHQLEYGFMDWGVGNSFELVLGDVATAAEWSVNSARAEDYRIPFGHVAHVRIQYLGCPNGLVPPPDMRAVVSGFFADRHNAAREAYLDNHWVINDANPADIVKDLIENSVYGLGYPVGTAVVTVGSDGNAASSYETYCDAFGLWIAMGIDVRVQVVDIIAQILQATNSVGFWDGDAATGQMTFRVVPLGDKARTANGVTFTPVLTALEITDEHLQLDGENPVLVRRRALADTFNSVPVEWSRDTLTRDVELVTAEMPDVASQDATGVRRSDPVSLPCIRTQAHASWIAKILTDRSLYARDEWEFQVNPRAAAYLQVGDMVSLNHAAMAVTGEILRIIETDENERGVLTIRAVKWLTATDVTVVTLPVVPVDGVPGPPRVLFVKGSGLSATYDDVSDGAGGYVYSTDINTKNPANTGILIGFPRPFQGIKAFASRISNWTVDPEGLFCAWNGPRYGTSESFLRGDTANVLTWVGNTGGFSLLTGATPGPRISVTSASFTASAWFETCWSANAPSESTWTVPGSWARGHAGLTLGTAFPTRDGDDLLYWVLVQNQLSAMTFARGDSVNSSRTVTFSSIEVIE
jgi:hypothetical protein